MNDEIRQAFEHPMARAEATAPLADRISLRGHIEEVEIGAFQAERGLKQRLRFDIVVEVASHAGAQTDDVDEILSYDAVTAAIQHELAAERLNLLETLAERIAARILTEPPAMRVFVRVEKLDRGTGALGVEIMREKQKLGAESGLAQISHHVVFLADHVAASPALGAYLATLAKEMPVILCVGFAASAAAPMQRQIDLLSIEQNAWALAGRVPRLRVVASRTELDWAIRNGQISIWAPSKMVLARLEAKASAPPTGAVELAAWLAAQMQATGLIIVGADIAEPSDFDGPIQILKELP